MKTKRVRINVEVPEDFDLDQGEIEFIEVLCARAAARGSSIEDTVACELNQARHTSEITGAKHIQGAVRELAGGAFAEGRDGDAMIIRAMASRLDPYIWTLERQRAEHQKLFITDYLDRQTRRRNGEKVD